MTPYRWVFEQSALDALLSLKSRQAFALVVRVNELAVHPFRSGHIVYRDSRQREVQVWLVDGFEFHYALDHAGREVRIAELRPDSFTLHP